VVHGSHSSVIIYYAKLPNTYLAEIAQYGANYSERSTLKQRVKFRRTKKFHMRDTGERVELFRLLAKLLWYLISGRSHVGYLFNYPGNPIHQAVLSHLIITSNRRERFFMTVLLLGVPFLMNLPLRKRREVLHL
jgi:hypothetical protein